jgi:hypothetical protein
LSTARMNLRRLERTDDDQPRKLPNIEREARRKALAARLPGLRLVGELDPSHAIVDLVTTMRDNDIYHHVPLNKCTKRDQEVLGKKKSSEFKDYFADLGSTRKFGLAFQRRALAFDIADLCPYETSMTIADRYMELIDEESVTMEQVQRADETLSVEIAKHCREGIKGRTGVCPIGDVIEKIFESSRIQLTLMPTQRQQANPGAGGGRPKPAPKELAQPNPNPRKRQRNNRPRNDEKVLPKATTSGKGDGKTREHAMPQAMLGTCGSKTTDEQNICFGFNLKTCPHKVQPGTRCPRGLHVCAKLKQGKACGGPHAFTDCA